MLRERPSNDDDHHVDLSGPTDVCLSSERQRSLSDADDLKQVSKTQSIHKR